MSQREVDKASEMGQKFALTTMIGWMCLGTIATSATTLYYHTQALSELTSQQSHDLNTDGWDINMVLEAMIGLSAARIAVYGLIMLINICTGIGASADNQLASVAIAGLCGGFCIFLLEVGYSVCCVLATITAVSHSDSPIYLNLLFSWISQFIPNVIAGFTCLCIGACLNMCCACGLLAGATALDRSSAPTGARAPREEEIQRQRTRDAMDSGI